jgi:hypothetical protein
MAPAWLCEPRDGEGQVLLIACAQAFRIESAQADINTIGWANETTQHSFLTGLETGKIWFLGRVLF